MEFEAILKHDRQIMVSRMLALDSHARSVRIKTESNRWIEAPVFSEAERDPTSMMDSILDTADRTWPKAEKLSVLHVSLANKRHAMACVSSTKTFDETNIELR